MVMVAVLAAASNFEVSGIEAGPRHAPFYLVTAAAVEIIPALPYKDPLWTLGFRVV